MAYIPEKIIQMRQCESCRVYFQERMVPDEAIVSICDSCKDEKKLLESKQSTVESS